MLLPSSPCRSSLESLPLRSGAGSCGVVSTNDRQRPAAVPDSVPAARLSPAAATAGRGPKARAAVTNAPAG